VLYAMVLYFSEAYVQFAKDFFTHGFFMEKHKFFI